jgi:hypothetical protein
VSWGDVRNEQQLGVQGDKPGQQSQQPGPRWPAGGGQNEQLTSFALRRNLLRRRVLAVDETHSEDEAHRCEETGSESGDIHSACAGEREAAPHAKQIR